MYYCLRGKGLFVIFGVLAVLALYYMVAGPSSSSTYSRFRHSSDQESEMGRLEKYMNEGPSLYPAAAIKSSFDWSSVSFTYPATKPVKLPFVGRPLPPIQHHNSAPEVPAEKRKRESRRQEVRKLFQKNWSSYRKHAWGKDALQPVSGTYKDQFSGWAATLVDSLDTLWIMGFRDEFDEAVAYVSSIDFGRSTTGRANMSETTIRYLGGLLAAYDLSGRRELLSKAVELGDLLYAGFNTPHRMPVDFIDFERAKSG